MDIEKRKYPTGTFSEYLKDPSRTRESDIRRIETLPDALVMMTGQFRDRHWDTPYREGGWTGRQVVHHMADSHMNAFCRLKLILTEDRPVIKTYIEGEWALQADSVLADQVYSVQIISGLHPRMNALIRSAKEEDWQRVCFHPEHNRELSFERMVALYAWHGRHHVAHLELILREG